MVVMHGLNQIKVHTIIYHCSLLSIIFYRFQIAISFSNKSNYYILHGLWIENSIKTGNVITIHSMNKRTDDHIYKHTHTHNHTMSEWVYQLNNCQKNQIFK